MKDRYIKVKEGTIAHLYKQGVYTGAIGGGLSFRLKAIGESFLIDIETDDKYKLLQLWASQIFIEDLEGNLIQLLDVKEVD